MGDEHRRLVLLAMASRDRTKPDDVCLNRLWYNLTVHSPTSAVAGDEDKWGRGMSEQCRAQLQRYFGWLAG